LVAEATNARPLEMPWSLAFDRLVNRAVSFQRRTVDTIGRLWPTIDRAVHTFEWQSATVFVLVFGAFGRFYILMQRHGSISC